MRQLKEFKKWAVVIIIITIGNGLCLLFPEHDHIITYIYGMAVGKFAL